MNDAIMNVRTQRQYMRLRRILEAGSGFDRTSASGDGWAVAIGAGSGPKIEPGAHVMHMQMEVCQHDVWNGLHEMGYPQIRSCTPTHRRTTTPRNVWTVSTSDHGLPVTLLAPITASGESKEKDQCANTGLLRKKSWIVTFGIRSDRFIHA